LIRRLRQFTPKYIAILRHSPTRNQFKVRMYYGSGTVDRITSRQQEDAAAASAYAAADAEQTLRLHSPDSSTFCVKWRHGRNIESLMSNQFRLRPSTPLYLKNNPAKFHPDPIWNDRALGFLKTAAPTTTRRTTTRWVVIWDQFLIPTKKNIPTSYFRFISITTAKVWSRDKSKMTLIVLNDARRITVVTSRQDWWAAAAATDSRTQVHSGRRLSIIHALPASHTNLLTKDDGNPVPQDSLDLSHHRGLYCYAVTRLTMLHWLVVAMRRRFSQPSPDKLSIHTLEPAHFNCSKVRESP